MGERIRRDSRLRIRECMGGGSDKMTDESGKNGPEGRDDEKPIKPPKPNLAGASGAASDTDKDDDKPAASDEERTMFGLLPRIQREQRQELLTYFEENASWNVDFVMMMALSTSIAALGLLNNSPPAVIGAMLVAPLMTPMLGAGFALMQGNVILFRDCFKAMSYGIGVSLFASLLMGLITPLHDPTPEIAARGNVNLLDLGVAFFSGMAAAYAGTRPKLASRRTDRSSTPSIEFIRSMTALRACVGTG